MADFQHAEKIKNDFGAAFEDFKKLHGNVPPGQHLPLLKKMFDDIFAGAIAAFQFGAGALASPLNAVEAVAEEIEESAEKAEKENIAQP